MKKVVTFIFVLLMSLIAFGQGVNPILKIGEKVTLYSEVLKETRDVWVYLPPNYTDKYFQAQNFPVLYVLDGDAHFHSLSGMVQILGSGINQTFAIPEMIIVAIPNTNRIRDLIPTRSAVGADGKEYDFFLQSGGADNFLKFITTELVPKIESTFRTFPYRILIGQSFGGLAVLQALYTMPESFNAYVAIEPSLWWDNQSLLKQRRDYFINANLKGRSLYLAQANSIRSWDKTNPHFEGIKELATLLDTRNKSGLHWSYKFYPDDDHASVALISEYDALRFFFKKYRVDFSNVSSAEQMRSQYQQLSMELGVTFLPPERVVQAFGSAYLSLDKYEAAQVFFQMNLDLYPNSSSAYANMGQYWKRKGEKRKAIEYYEKSVKIFPQNEDSLNNIKNLKKEIEDSK